MTDFAEAPTAFVIAVDTPLNQFEFEDEIDPGKDLKEALSGLCLRNPKVCESVVAEGIQEYAIWVGSERATASKCAAIILEKAGCRNMIGRPSAESGTACK